MRRLMKLERYGAAGWLWVITDDDDYAVCHVVRERTDDKGYGLWRWDYKANKWDNYPTFGPEEYHVPFKRAMAKKHLLKWMVDEVALEVELQEEE